MIKAGIVIGGLYIGAMVLCNTLRWQRLGTANINQLTELFAGSEASKWILAAAHTDNIRQALEQRIESDQANQSLGFVVCKDFQPIGIAGLSVYKGGGMQSYVYLHDHHWGQGYNQLINQCLAALAFEHLQLKTFVASINISNVRSRKGMTKAFPGAAITEVYEPWHNRHAWLLHVTPQCVKTVTLGPLQQLIQDCSIQTS